jgi:DNA invertase Pin-like site-specific DNA recombinase
MTCVVHWASPTSFLDDTPTARLIRQMLGAVSEFEKAMLVAKLRGRETAKRALASRSRAASQARSYSRKQSSLRDV